MEIIAVTGKKKTQKGGKMIKYVFTADDEEPDCMRCDSVHGSYDMCEQSCGPEHGWGGYSRTEYVERREDEATKRS